MTILSKFVSSPILLGSIAVLGATILVRWYKEKEDDEVQQIIVCSELSHWEAISELFLEECKAGLLGVDCEWVNVKSGAKRVALLQVASSNYLCVLIRLCKMDIPEQLRQVLADYRIVKFGVGVFEDAKKLYKDYGIEMNSCLDIRFMALASGYSANNIQGLSLASLSSHFAYYPLDKDIRVRVSNWEAWQLSREQIRYAGRDAFAGLRVGHALCRKSLDSVGFDDCYVEFSMYFDVPFRKIPQQTVASRNSYPTNSQAKPTLRPVTRHDQKVYKNAVLKAPDGEILCNTDTVKVSWYLKMNLATLESETPLIARLNFEPRCRAILGGEYYVDEKLNICVVCGSEKSLLKKNVVPQEYRKLFPELMKSHTSHDSVLICIDCQFIATKEDARLRSTLDSECPNEVEMPSFQALKRAARALVTAGDKLPLERRELFTNIIECFFNEPLSERRLQEVLQLKEQWWLRANNLTHAQRVVAMYKQNQGLFALESRLRQHFLDSMKPQFLSPKWSITHNHDAVLMKMATGRYAGPETYDEFLKIVGSSWKRVGELINALVEEGVISREQVVVWDQLTMASFEAAHNNEHYFEPKHE